MVTCSEVTVLITREVDGLISDDARAQLSDHLARCADCRAAAEVQREVAHLVRSRPAAPVPLGFAARVSARVAEDLTWFGMAEWRAWTWRLLPVAAALLVAAAWLSASSVSSTVSRQASVSTVATAASDTAPSAVLWEDNVTSDQLLLTVLTGNRAAVAQGNAHE